VVGGGDTALEEALILTKFAKKIYIIHRRGFFRASKIMQERVLKNKKIEIIWNTIVEEIVGEKKVEGIQLKILDPRSQILDKTQHIKHLSSNIYHLTLDGVFVAIGHKPDTDLFKNQIELDEKGYVKILKRRLTSVPGVFVAGDCADPYYRQAITAAGTGVEAALEVERYLET
jgi:thioredoxin reductase (NADPH)